MTGKDARVEQQGGGMTTQMAFLPLSALSKETRAALIKLVIDQGSLYFSGKSQYLIDLELLKAAFPKARGFHHAGGELLPISFYGYLSGDNLSVAYDEERFASAIPSYDEGAIEKAEPCDERCCGADEEVKEVDEIEEAELIVVHEGGYAVDVNGTTLHLSEPAVISYEDGLPSVTLTISATRVVVL